MTQLEINLLEDICEKLVSIDEKLKTIDDKLESYDNEVDLFKKAVKFVTKDKTLRPSKLQKELKIGYNKAARYIDEMIALGIVESNKGA